MTTNYITRLNETLTRPGHVDKKVKLRLTDKKMTAKLFYLIFKPMEGNLIPTNDAQSDILVREDEKALKATRKHEANIKRVK
jgi:chaperone BCS1